MRPEVGACALTLTASLAMAAAPAWAAPRDPTGGCPGLQSEQEPNDTAASASPIVLWNPDTFFTAIYGTMPVPGDVDWYSFAAPAGARLWLSVNTGVAGSSESRDSVVSVFAPDGVTLIEDDDDDGTGNGWDDTIESLDASVIAGAVLPAGGTYYARVRAKDAGATIAGYSVLIGLTTAAPAMEVEPTPPCRQMFGPLLLGSLSSSADVDCYEAGTLDSGLAFVVVDGDPERDGIGTDTTVAFQNEFGQVLVTNSSRAGDAANPPAEGFALLGPGTVTVTGAGPGSYLLGFLSSTDTCPLPVVLQAFEIE
jgi:hypothetical protein